MHTRRGAWLAFERPNGEPVVMKEPHAATVIDAGAIFASDELDPVPDRRLVLDGRRIGAITTRSEGEPDGAEILDARDLLVVPGFIDAHVHIGLADPRKVLAGGVTTARDLAWPRERIRSFVQESTRPNFAGPLVVAAGQMLTAAGGYPTRAAWAPAGTGRVVDGTEDAAAAVAEQIEIGAGVIKIALNPPVGPVLNDETLTAIAGAAHERGLKITAHLYGVDQLERALDAGVDELAHMVMSPEIVPDDLIERMVAREMVIVPTLSIRFEDQPIAIENTRRFVEAGGTVLYGTDLGNAGPEPGIDKREIAAMAAAGLSARDIVRSATVAAAGHLGLASKGRIAPGMDADLIALPLSAMEDPAGLIDVRHVWREGRLVR